MQKCSDAIVFTITTMLCRWLAVIPPLLLLLISFFSSFFPSRLRSQFGLCVLLLLLLLVMCFFCNLAYGICDYWCDKIGSKNTKAVIKQKRQEIDRQIHHDKYIRLAYCKHSTKILNHKHYAAYNAVLPYMPQHVPNRSQHQQLPQLPSFFSSFIRTLSSIFTIR